VRFTASIDRRNLVDDGLGRVGVAMVREHDVGPALGEQPADRGADTPAATGDERNSGSVREVIHGAVFCTAGPRLRAVGSLNGIIHDGRHMVRKGSGVRVPERAFPKDTSPTYYFFLMILIRKVFDDLKVLCVVLSEANRVVFSLP
jgi:hypothetical protein